MSTNQLVRVKEADRRSTVRLTVLISVLGRPFCLVGLCTQSKLTQLLRISHERQERQRIWQTHFKYHNTDIRYNPCTLDGTRQHPTFLHVVPCGARYHFAPTNVSNHNTRGGTKSRTNSRDHITLNYHDRGRRASLQQSVSGDIRL